MLAEDTDPSTALLAYNTERELKNTLEISFNISISTRHVDIIRFAMLRLYRQSLTPNQLEIVKRKCGSDFDLSNVTLQIYSRSGTIGNLSTFSLRAVHSLYGSDLAEEEWVEFMNLTRMYKDLVDSVHNSPHRNITFRLAVRAPCSSITPTELGFVFTTSKQKPQLVEFAENALQKEMTFSQVLSLSNPTDSQSHLSKRQASDDSGGNSSRMLATLPNHLEFFRCQLFSFQVSF